VLPEPALLGLVEVAQHLLGADRKTAPDLHVREASHASGVTWT
jgi:hypothetical protein